MDFLKTDFFFNLRVETIELPFATYKKISQHEEIRKGLTLTEVCVKFNKFLLGITLISKNPLVDDFISVKWASILRHETRFAG